MTHTYAGRCPDALQPDSRDPECSECRDIEASERYRAALEEIRSRTLGRVCEDYELCDHEACRASLHGVGYRGQSFDEAGVA